jgi:hypothetical protein
MGNVLRLGRSACNVLRMTLSDQTELTDEQRDERASRRLTQLTINVRDRLFEDRVQVAVRRRAELLNSSTAARESVADDIEQGRLRP